MTRANTVASLDYRHIAKVRSYGVTNEGRPYLEMTYYANGTLSSRAPQAPRDVLRIGVQLCAALQTAHNLNPTATSNQPTCLPANPVSPYYLISASPQLMGAPPHNPRFGPPPKYSAALQLISVPISTHSVPHFGTCRAGSLLSLGTPEIMERQPSLAVSMHPK